MRVSVLPNTLVFEGVLDEETSLDHLSSAYQQLKKSNPTLPITLDFSKVSRANSAGLVTWLKFLQSAHTKVKYVNTPVWLVGQFNMIKGYFTNGSYVESVQIPLYSTAAQYSKIVTIKLGKDVPILPDYSDFKLPNQMIEGHEYEVDFDPAQYFSFISEHYDTFRENIK